MSFKVLLPLAPTESIKHAEKNSLSLGLEKSKSVLLVEDSSSQVELISLIFEENNISFDVVKNGLEGFDLFFQNPEKYDLVLTDNSMPEMNGIDMSKYILSEFPGTNIVLLTGDINSAVVKKCDKIGIGEIFLKPIKSDELIKLVNSYTKKQLNSNNLNGIDMMPYLKSEAKLKMYYKKLQIYVLASGENYEKPINRRYGVIPLCTPRKLQ